MRYMNIMAMWVSFYALWRIKLTRGQPPAGTALHTVYASATRPRVKGCRMYDSVGRE